MFVDPEVLDVDSPNSNLASFFPLCFNENKADEETES